MNTYKITNITDKLGKRDVNNNSTLNISFVDEMIPKTIPLKPSDVMYFTGEYLPLSVHRLRVKNLVSVIEISERELKDIQDTKKAKNNKTTTTTTTKKPKTSLSNSKSSTKSSTTNKKSSKFTSTKKSESNTTTTTTKKVDDKE